MAAATELVVVIKAQDLASGKLKQLQSNVGGFSNAIQQHQKAIGIAMAAIGVAIVGAGLLTVRAFEGVADEVEKMSLRTGLGIKTLSELRLIAERSGTSLSLVERASRTLAGAITDAQDGLTTYTRAFERIGVDYNALAKMSPEDQFWAVLKALAATEDMTIRAATAADVFGRAGTMLLPIMAGGVQGLEDMKKRAAELGIVLSDEAARKGVVFKDAMTDLKFALEGVKLSIGEALLPVLRPLVDKFIEIFVWVNKLIDAVPGLSVVLVGTTLTMGALMIPVGALLLALPTLNAACLVLIGITLPALIARVWALVAGLWAAVAAFIALTGPVGLAYLAGGVLAVGAAIYGVSRLVKMAMPSMQYGGVVPGAIGQPVPIMAHGGERYLGAKGGSLGKTEINLNVGYMLGDREDAEKLLDFIQSGLRGRQRIGLGEGLY